MSAAALEPRFVDHRLRIIPERFSFADINPLTGFPYARSSFGDLPPYAMHVIDIHLGVTPTEWDDAVAAGEAYSISGWQRTYAITSWLRQERRYRKGRRAGGNTCPDCFGTTVDFDADGSVTGRVGTPILCWCAGG
jgi:hypothetical protein